MLRAAPFALTKRMEPTPESRWRAADRALRTLFTELQALPAHTPKTALLQRAASLQRTFASLAAEQADALREVCELRTRATGEVVAVSPPPPTTMKRRSESAAATYLTMADLLARLGVQSRSTLYARFPDVLELRRGLGPKGAGPFRWLKSDIDDWFSRQPKGRIQTKGPARR